MGGSAESRKAKSHCAARSPKHKRMPETPQCARQCRQKRDICGFCIPKTASYFANCRMRANRSVSFSANQASLPNVSAAFAK